MTSAKKRIHFMIFMGAAMNLTAIIPVKAYAAVMSSPKCSNQSSKTTAANNLSDPQQGIQNFSLEPPDAGQTSQTKPATSGQSSVQTCSKS